MGLNYEDLTEETRRYMVEEIASDAREERLYRSPWLSQTGQGDWEDILTEAARVGTDDTLAVSIQERGRLSRTAQRRKPKGIGYTAYEIPRTAPVTMAEGEFNRFYIRGLCCSAIAQGIIQLEVYRAKIVSEPRPESERKIGQLMNPVLVLADLRKSNGVETALGVPSGPNSGLTLRIPRTRI